MQFLSTYLGDNKLWQFSALFAALALFIIIAVIVVRLLFTRRLRAPGGRGRQARLGVVDAFDLDRQRQLVLVRRDNVEHLIMIGGPTDVVIETSIMRSQVVTGQRDSAGQTASPLNEAPRAPNGQTQVNLAALQQPIHPQIPPAAPSYQAEAPRQPAPPPRPVAPPPPVRAASLPPVPQPSVQQPQRPAQPSAPPPRPQSIPVVLAPPESAPVRQAPIPVPVAMSPRALPGALAVPPMLEHLVREMPPAPAAAYTPPRPAPPPRPTAPNFTAPALALPAAPAGARADDPFDSLEAEMAKLLGR